MADMALRLSSKALRPWVPLEESRRLLAEALPLVGALEAPSEAVQSDRGFIASVPPEGPASEVRGGEGGAIYVVCIYACCSRCCCRSCCVSCRSLLVVSTQTLIPYSQASHGTRCGNWRTWAYSDLDE